MKFKISIVLPLTLLSNLTNSSFVLGLRFENLYVKVGSNNFLLNLKTNI